MIIYRPLVFEKFIFLLYNYSFHPPHINHCLFNYFNNMYSYTDDNANATLIADYDASHPEVKAIFRPHLFNVLLFEVLNRILHDPLTTMKTDKSTERSDLIELAELAKKIVVFLSSLHVVHFFRFCSCFPSRSIRRGCFPQNPEHVAADCSRISRAFLPSFLHFVR